MTKDNKRFLFELLDWGKVLGGACGLCFGPTLILASIYSYYKIGFGEWYHIVLFIGVMVASPFIMIYVMTHPRFFNDNDELDTAYRSQW